MAFEVIVRVSTQDVMLLRFRWRVGSRFKGTDTAESPAETIERAQSSTGGWLALTSSRYLQEWAVK
jgi:hypothetical protein